MEIKVLNIKYGSNYEYHFKIRLNSRMTISKVDELCRKLSTEYRVAKVGKFPCKIEYRDGHVCGIEL